MMGKKQNVILSLKGTQKHNKGYDAVKNRVSLEQRKATIL